MIEYIIKNYIQIHSICSYVIQVSHPRPLRLRTQDIYNKGRIADTARH